jgi:transcriptional activator of cad operon
MNRPNPTTLRIGAWCVSPSTGQISRDGETVRVEARTMRLLLCLAEHAGEVVSIDDLLSQAWSGVIVSQDSVYQAVTSLRRTLGDDPKQPTYIATVPRLGYRMVAAVGPWIDQPAVPVGASPPSGPAHPIVAAADARPAGARRGVVIAAGAALSVGLMAVSVFLGKAGSNRDAASPARPQKSVAVLPFLDLTEGMNQEYFADGMTEELIDKLSKVADLRVPAATTSFYFKGRQSTIADVAKALGAAYVLDGSVRKSGTALRVAARLIRADNGNVVWSDTYDRPLGDILKIQDDIAAEVTKSLRASIVGGGP